MKIRSAFLLILASVILSANCLMAQDTKPWYQDAPFRMLKVDPKARLLPLIKVSGNKFVDPQGKTPSARVMGLYPYRQR